MHRLAIILLSVLLAVAPVIAQDSTPAPVPVVVDPGSGFTVTIPEGSPWWAGIALVIIGAGAEGFRRYSKRLDAKQQAAIDEAKNEFTLQLERLKIEATTKSADAVQIDALASSIRGMAESVNSTIQAFAQDRIEAREERRRMMDAQDAQAKGIQERNQVTRDLGKKIEAVNEVVQPMSKQLETVVEKLDELSKQAEDFATRQQLNEVIKLVQQVKDCRNDAPQPSPAPTPPAERDSIGEVEKE